MAKFPVGSRVFLPYLDNRVETRDYAGEGFVVIEVRPHPNIPLYVIEAVDEPRDRIEVAESVLFGGRREFLEDEKAKLLGRMKRINEILGGLGFEGK